MSRHDTPIVGVTGPDSGGWLAWALTRYAIRRAGGTARRITPSRPCEVHEVDALIVGGGADVDPTLYNEERMMPQIRKAMRQRQHERTKHLRRSTFSVDVDLLLPIGLWLLRKLFSSPWHQTGDRERDRMETRLIKEATDRGLPVLGICRGMQLINVVFGGTLHQEIVEFYEETPHLRTILPKKKIEIAPMSRLHRLLGSGLARVNSLHHQSVKTLGDGLHVTALEPNGIIQGIEHEDYPFLIGVQWHPEFLPHIPAQAEIFRELVRTAIASRFSAISPTSFSQTQSSIATR